MQRRVLIVKISSMGDVIHMLSAVQEASRALPQTRFDWVCEEAFADLPRLCTAVDRVIPVAIRRWRRSLGTRQTRLEIKRFIQALRQEAYDLVIDGQGLLKTAWITRLAPCDRRHRWGFDWSSSREPLSSLVYGQKVHAPFQGHAIDRLRTLLGAALGFFPEGPIAILGSPPHASLYSSAFKSDEKTVMFFHGTSRAEKSWPVAQWAELGRALGARGFRLLLPQGSDAEAQTAQTIARAIGPEAEVLTPRPIGELVSVIRRSAGVIGVDSGLMHLAVALGLPTVAIMAASHLQRFSHTRFAPSWAPHARVVVSDGQIISAGRVLESCKDLGL